MSPPASSTPSPSPAPAGDVIHFDCWSCNISLTVPRSMAGVSGPCPQCGATIAAPSLSTTALTPMAPEPPLPLPRSLPLASHVGPSQSEELPAIAHVWMGWPMILVALGGLIGGVCGGLAYAINRSIFRENSAGSQRYALSGLVSVAAVIVWLMVASVASDMMGGKGASTTSAPKLNVANARTVITARGEALDFDVLRSEAIKQSGDIFHDEDFTAAETAARASVADGADTRWVMDAYGRVLGGRAPARQMERIRARNSF